MVDLLIKNGLIIDGTGNPGFYGAVVVEGDTLRILRGDVSSIEAGRVIDAADHVVSPGFIDLHSHAGLTMLREPKNEPKIRQGVTTELIGIDGNSAAPFKTREDLEAFVEMDSGLNDVMPAGRDWRSVDDFLSMYQKTVSPNIAFIVGNSPVRIWSMGWNNRPASGEDLEDMKAVLRETMEEGSFGLSTGLDYPPGAYADTNELIELSKVVAEKGGFYHTHTRAQLRRISHLAPFEEAVDIGRGSGVPVHLTHYRQPAQGTGTHFDYLGLVENSRDEGIDVTFDCYTYVFSGTRILIELPNWAKDGGPGPLKENLRSDEQRKRMKEDMLSGPRAMNMEEMWLTAFRKPDNAKYDGHSLAEIGRMRSQDPLDALFDLLLAEDLGISFVAVGTNPQTLPDFVAHPHGMVASDAILFGEWPSPRTYGCFPVVLAEFVRAEKQLRLPEAIRKMTSFPAQRLGLRERGVLRDGAKADIVIFNPKTVKAPATRANPKQYPLGIPYVIVNGQVVVDEGQHTGATPGTVLRHGRD